MMEEKPWRPADFTDNLPEYKLRETAPPSVDLPAWYEPALVACILALAVIVLVLAIVPGIANAHPVQS